MRYQQFIVKCNVLVLLIPLTKIDSNRKCVLVLTMVITHDSRLSVDITEVLGSGSTVFYPKCFFFFNFGYTFDRKTQ